MPDTSNPIVTNPIVIDHASPTNPAGLSAADVKRLIAGGPPGTLRWLYPYDETVFPSGMLAPTLMWSGDQSTEAIYVRIKSIAFEYKTVIKPVFTAPTWVVPNLADRQPQPQLLIPQDVWDTACAQTQGKDDVFTVELSTQQGGVVAGPVVTHFYIASAPVRGSLYYTTYWSGGTGVNSLMRIPPRGTAQTVLGNVESGGCGGCHSIAANGSRVVVQTQEWAPLPNTATANQGWTYELSPGGMASMPARVNPFAAFVALYPDGSKYLTPALKVDLTPGALLASYSRYADLAVSISQVPIEATLYDTATAKPVPDTGIPPGALTPMFSPDGRYLAFNDANLSQAHGLAVMDYDPEHHKASNYRVVTMEDVVPGSNSVMPGMRPVWPFFLPDNQALVFARTDSIADFTGGSGSFISPGQADLQGDRTAATSGQSSSDLFIVDLETKNRVVLAKAMGFNTPEDFDRNTPNLPFGASDTHHNFSPTVSPVASGGYFWVFWDSVRNYGNLGQQSQLWGAAIDIRSDGSYTVDPSHPAFYVPGQQSASANHRAFSARDACRPEGDPCQIGIDCCTGFCAVICTPPPKDGCAKLDEHCETAADCCDSSNYCISGFCAFVPLL